MLFLLVSGINKDTADKDIQTIHKQLNFNFLNQFEKANDNQVDFNIFPHPKKQEFNKSLSYFDSTIFNLNLNFKLQESNSPKKNFQNLDDLNLQIARTSYKKNIQSMDFYSGGFDDIQSGSSKSKLKKTIQLSFYNIQQFANININKIPFTFQFAQKKDYQYQLSSFLSIIFKSKMKIIPLKEYLRFVLII